MAKRPAPLDPAALTAAREQFERWRRTRSRNTRIPEHLWTSAVRIARTYGISRAIKELRLDYYSLKARMEDMPAERPGVTEPAKFVEIAPLTPTRECVVELKGQHGRTIRMTLRGLSENELATLARRLAE